MAGLFRRWRQPKARAAMATAATPARRYSIGKCIQPWSAAYFSSAATPRNSTIAPTFIGTLPVVNQFLIASKARMPGSWLGCGAVSKSGRDGVAGTGCGCGFGAGVGGTGWGAAAWGASSTIGGAASPTRLGAGAGSARVTIGGGSPGCSIYAGTDAAA